MRSDFRWAIPIGAELALVIVLLFFAEVHSWSSSSTTWALIAMLALATYVNEKIWRREERIARSQGKPWRPRGRAK
jgi:cyanate permease